MAQPAYQIAILDPLTGAMVALLDAGSIYDLRYSRSLNDIGLLAMTLPSTVEIRGYFTLDAFIEVYRADRTGTLILEETYLTRLTHRFIEGDEERFVVGGVSLNHLMSRRVIDPADDITATDGHSTKSGNADIVIYNYCNEQMGPAASIPRRTPGLSIVASPIGRPVAASMRFEYLFNQIQTLSKAGAVDFQIVRTTGANLELQIGAIGSDKTYGTNAPLNQPWVGLSPQRGNLTQPSILIDRKKEGNYVYALGQGQGMDRVIYQAAGPGILDSPFNRFEFTQDMRNIDKLDLLGLQTGADAILKDKTVRNEFTYQPTGTEPGNIYREDWDLGDAVTIEWDETLLDLRIINVEISISSKGETITATVTDDFIFPGTPYPVDVEFPKRATLWHPSATAGSPVWIIIDNSMRYAFYAYLSSHSNGDVFTQSFLLRAGTYTFSVLGYAGGISGKIDWYLDGILFKSGQDWYGAGVPNTIQTAPVTVLTDGYHVLSGVVNGKNGASGGYYIALAKYWFKATVD